MAHFSFKSFFQIGLLLILICWTKESTGASFSLEEEFKQLKIQMNEIVKNLESEMSEVKAKDFQMQNKMNELELRDVEMRNKVTELEAKIAQQDSLLFDLLQEKNERTAAAANFEFAPMRSNGSAVLSINGLPSSCSDLKLIGHTLNGFYSIAGSAMMESVYCNFNKLSSDPDFQKWIGYNDVKSAPVHFYVQRESSFNTTNTPIPWDVAVVNEGNAMNLQTGKFTAQRPGIYFFSFTGRAQFPPSSSYVYLRVTLYLNGGQIGVGQVDESNTPGQYSPVTLQSTLNLKSGDQVWLEIFYQSTEAYLFDNGIHFTHFTGFMLEEDIVASLL